MLVLEAKLTCIRFPSLCNEFDGSVLVPIGKLTRVRFHWPCIVVVLNALVLVLEAKLTCIVQCPCTCIIRKSNMN